MDDFSKLSDDELRAIAGLEPGAPVPPAKKPWSASILPLSEDEQGNLRFDSNAGVFGGLKRAFTLPGEVYKGEVDPTSPEGIARAAELATVASPVNPAVRAGGNFAGSLTKSGMKAPDVKPPSTEALLGTAKAQFKAGRESGVDYSASSVANLAKGIKAKLEQDGLLGKVAPRTHSILDELASPPEGAVAPIANVDAARKAFRALARNFNQPEDQAAASRAMADIVDFMARSDAGDVVAGPAAAAAKLFSEGRGNYAAGKRAQTLTGEFGGVIDRANLNASAANSGQNLDNSIRALVRGLLQDPKKRSGFNAEELGMLREVVEGTPGRNAARFTGNLLGGGGGLGTLVTGLGTGTAAGAALGGPGGALVGALAGGAAPAAGVTAKQIANRLTANSLMEADKAVRMRSPLYEAMKREAPMEVISPEARAALIRLLMQSQAAQGQQ